MSADPYQASGGPAVPQSWNRFAYASNDPVNHFDSMGLDDDCSDDPADGGCIGPNELDFTNGSGIITSTPGCGMVTYYSTPLNDPGCWLPAVSSILVPVVAQGPCPGIAQQIWNTITGVGMPNGKSLLTRVVEQITGDPSKFENHQEQIDNYRNRLRKLRRNWRNNDCDPPDDPPFGTNDWIKQTSGAKLTVYQQEYQQYLQDLQIVAAGGATAAVASQAQTLFSSIIGFIESLAGDALLVPIL